MGGMKLIHTTHNVKYLPHPNCVEFIVTYKLAPFDLTKTAFVIPFVDEKRVILAHNQRRGLEIPGGHIDPGEDFFQAAKRECLEETGYGITDIVPLGYLKMTSGGDVPNDWGYPHPISYQQFFAGVISSRHPFESNDECREPSMLKIDNLGPLNDEQRMLIGQAHRLIFPDCY